MSSLLDFLDDDNDGYTEGERLRDAAFGNLQMHRPYLIRRLQIAFVQHILVHGPSTSDPIRDAVPIPAGTDPRVVGCAVQLLSKQHGITKSVDSGKTRRKVAHARQLQVWAIRDENAARRWLTAHAIPTPDSSADPTDPYAP